MVAKVEGLELKFSDLTSTSPSTACGALPHQTAVLGGTRKSTPTW